MNSLTTVAIYLAAIFAYADAAYAQLWQTDGNLKYRFVNTAYPDNSIFNDFAGGNAADHNFNARINLKLTAAKWSGEASYQIAALYGDTFEYSRGLTDGLLFRSPLARDDTRLLNLTDQISNRDNYGVVQRLDRLNIAYRSDSKVIRLGRQAVSWGNGLIYTPMDFFNPFDPTDIDTEYKAGDDMLYAQHLFKSGNDLQLVWVARRNEVGQSTHEANSVALKYHGLVGSNEFDLLFAEHYQDTIVGVGGSLSIAGSVVRGDWVVTEVGDQRFNNVVANISYSWTAWDKNVSSSLEYFHNDFGVRSDQLSLPVLANNQELIDRIARAELFTLSRDYLAGSVLVEMAPLWLVTSNVFYSLSDNSALTQVVSQHDLSQNTQLVVALSAPIGPNGTEFGGFSVGNDTTSEEQFSNNDWSLYAQIAWYF